MRKARTVRPVSILGALAGLSWLTMQAIAEDPVAVAKYKNIYDASVADIDAQHRECVSKALAGYSESLRQIKAELEKAGDYDGTVAITKESTRFEKEKTLPGGLSLVLPSAVAEKVSEATKSVSQCDAAKREQVLDLTRKYSAALDRLMKQLLPQKKMQAAAEANREIEKAQGLISLLAADVPKEERVPTERNPPTSPPVADAPTHQIMLQATLGGVKKTDEKPSGTFLHYRKHTSRTMTVNIKIRNILDTEDTITVAWFIMGRRVDETDCVVFEKKGKKIKLKPKQTEELQVTSLPAIIKEDKFFSNIPDAEGWKSLDGYVVIAEADGQVLKRVSSSRALQGLAETLTTEGMRIED